MQLKKTIKDFNLKDKKVIIRCDFNVPIENGIIKDDYRIIQSLRTIKYAIRHSAKIILISHLGRVKTEEDKTKYTLKPVAQRLEELLERKVTFIPNIKEAKPIINKMKNRNIVLLENTRYADLDGNLESKNDEEYGKYLSSLGDIFINDAFGTSHRSHASNVGIASNLPSGIGFLIEKELKYLTKIPIKPYAVILGGAKVSDKIGLIDNLASKADCILIGGAMAFTFLKAAGFETGSSLVEKDYISYCTKLLNKYEDKVILPIDIVCEEETKFINEIKEEDIGYDVGNTTIKIFTQYINECKTIYWNGPLGCFEESKYSKGTKALLRSLSKSSATVIALGGDTASAVRQFNYEDKISFISTGGGASLELLEGKKLPGIEAIDNKGENHENTM